jgi:hypothetical protein
VAGYAWLDRNGNGVRETYESGLVGVTLKLFDASGQIGETSTGGDGGYRWTELAPGSYRVVEVQPAWLRFSSTPDERVVLVTAGGEAVADFGDWSGSETWLPLVVR